MLQSRYLDSFCLLVPFKMTIWFPENLELVELIPNKIMNYFNVINYAVFSGF